MKNGEEKSLFLCIVRGWLAIQSNSPYRFTVLVFLRVLKGYSTLREGIRVFRGERLSGGSP
jgi:hypothetical protein